MFEYKGRKERLSLKPEYRKRVDSIIKTASDKHGSLTPAYFREIEHRCFDVWAEFDRCESFVEEHLPTEPSTEQK